jgi:hypothetical protein
MKLRKKLVKKTEYKDTFSKSYVLVQYRDNYADEHDVYGFAVVPKATWLKVSKRFQEKAQLFWDWGFGTNQYITYSDWQSLRSTLTIKYIALDEYKYLMRMFNLTASNPIYGQMPWVY